MLNDFPNNKILGLDNINDYYDVSLKKYRLKAFLENKNFTFIKGNLADKELIRKIFIEYKPAVVVNLAAQAGVKIV